MNIWEQFTSDFIFFTVFIFIIWGVVKYKGLVNENAELKKKNNKEILASVHDIAVNAKLDQLIGDPDDLGVTGNDIKPK